MLHRHAAILAALAVAGCSAEPGAPLFAPSAPARLAPDQAAVPAVGPDGFPNVLVTPAPVPGTWRPEEDVAADEAALAARGRRTEAQAGAATRGPSFAPALRARGATHAEEARRAIEGSARPGS